MESYTSVELGLFPGRLLYDRLIHRGILIHCICILVLINSRFGVTVPRELHLGLELFQLRLQAMSLLKVPVRAIFFTLQLLLLSLHLLLDQSQLIDELLLLLYRIVLLGHFEDMLAL